VVSKERFAVFEALALTRVLVFAIPDRVDPPAARVACRLRLLGVTCVGIRFSVGCAFIIQMIGLDRP